MGFSTPLAQPPAHVSRPFLDAALMSSLAKQKRYFCRLGGPSVELLSEAVALDKVRFLKPVNGILLGGRRCLGKTCPWDGDANPSAGTTYAKATSTTSATAS